MSGGSATVEKVEKKLREEAKRLLAEKKVDVVVGYEAGTLPLDGNPLLHHSAGRGGEAGLESPLRAEPGQVRPRPPEPAP